MEKLDSLFVKHHREVLIQRVTSEVTSVIADELRGNTNIPMDFPHSLIQEAPADAKMNMLLQALSTHKAISTFYSVLQAKVPNLVKELEHQDAQFVVSHSDELIQKVNPVMPIADSLKAGKIIHEETYSKIDVASIPQNKMRKLLDALSTNKAKSAFYNLLKDNAAFRVLVEDLKRQGVKQEIPGSSAQKSSEVLETESRSQNTEIQQMQATQKRSEGKQITWRNESSTIHRTKIKEMLRERNLKNIDSLYFYKDEKYMISSEESNAQVYIGMREDGIEVAIKLITKNPKNNNDFENELKLLQNKNLESKNIVKYMTFAQDNDFYYLANQLCEYDLEEYMKSLRQSEQNNEKETTLRSIMKDMLHGLQVLHHADVIHRDIKPGNVLIDLEKTARLADFGISRKLEKGKTTVKTKRDGTQGWEATEIVNQPKEGSYKKSSDIQVAGMLAYYILSDGKHPFGDPIRREGNISDGNYSLDIQDITAKDLIEWMINKEQDKRPTIDKVLNHPYFWDDKRIREVLHSLGNKEEVENYKNYETKNKELYDIVQKHTEGKTFFNWKSKAPQTWPKFSNFLPNDLLGLLRHLRNALTHNKCLFDEEKMIDEFPDFLISLHRLAMDMSWEY
ncbi:hypothetical protein Q8A67_001176 [Cirrhinus molitorella]|uniref:Uncharacterized protein n=1 Tax=Cirrhinus molitorella TaxID=172907 RepID=A0AA88QDY1_9TELE|nr:hypothetical protein Q8A67_001176 [Cirrhinus molitorella]